MTIVHFAGQPAQIKAYPNIVRIGAQSAFASVDVHRAAPGESSVARLDSRGRLSVREPWLGLASAVRGIWAVRRVEVNVQFLRYA